MASVFAQIVEGKLPCHKIYENDSFLAFLDINPIKLGHTLVIPKQEIDYIFDLDDSVKPLGVKYSDLSTTLGEALMAQHVSYYSALKPSQHLLKGMAHITGGGIVENLPRIIPEPLKCIVRTDSWEIPALFNIIQRQGNVDLNEMYRVFNMGVGLIGIVRPEDAEMVMSSFDGSFVMGEITSRESNESRIEFL